MDGLEVYYSWARNLRDTPDEAWTVPEQAVALPSDASWVDLVAGSWLMIRTLASAIAVDQGVSVQAVGDAMMHVDPDTAGSRPALRVVRSPDPPGAD
jgi:hypothetical protein